MNYHGLKSNFQTDIVLSFNDPDDEEEVDCSDKD